MEYSFSGQVKMKQAEIWFHMKNLPIYEDICTRLLYFDIPVVCGPDTTGNSNCEKQNKQTNKQNRPAVVESL
jgi:hypothetical protein